MNRFTYHILPLIERCLRAAPVDWRGIFSQAGLPSPALAQNAPTFIELDDLYQAFTLVEEETGDDHFILRYYDTQAYAFYPTLYSGLISLSANMRELMATYRRYSPLHTAGDYRLDFHERGGYCEADFSLRGKLHPGAIHFLDFQLMMLNSGSERLSGRGFPGLKLDLIRKSCDESLYRSYFPGIQIRCGMPQTRMFGDTEMLERRFRPDNTRLPRILKERAEHEILRVEDESDFLRDLRVLVVTTLEQGELTAERTATKLGMSRRGFFRKLKAEELTFKQVIDQVRHENALRFLLESDRDLEDIALLLGFSCERSFRRFFLTVEGVTPVQYRKRYR